MTPFDIAPAAHPRACGCDDCFAARRGIGPALALILIVMTSVAAILFSLI